jgi:hypothetical protein
MPDWFEIPDGYNPDHVVAVLAASLVMLVGTSLLVPIVVARLPDDFFLSNRPQQRTASRRHWAVHLLLVVLRNLIGLPMVVAGVIMLVTPGQGVLSILVGLMLADFPGKHALLIRIVRVRRIRQMLNWIRRKAGKSLLQFDAHDQRPSPSNV